MQILLLAGSAGMDGASGVDSAIDAHNMDDLSDPHGAGPDENSIKPELQDGLLQSTPGDMQTSQDSNHSQSNNSLDMSTLKGPDTLNLSKTSPPPGTDSSNGRPGSNSNLKARSLVKSPTGDHPSGEVL